MQRTMDIPGGAPRDTQKRREILFSRFPPGQVPEARTLLEGLPALQVADHRDRPTLSVAYRLENFTLQGLEAGLTDQGFHLDNTLLAKLRRALIYYVEETQLHNLGAPTKPLKDNSRDAAYVQAWDRELHGDRDDTPEEWRHYR